VDSRAGALREAGDVLLPIGEGAIAPSHIIGELGDVVAGQAPGRRTAADVTIFKSLGMAVEDVVAANLAVERAGAANIGRSFTLE
jgi:ornithine cyclodeaminase